MLDPASWYWGNRRRFVLLLMVAVMLPFALLARPEPIRELRDCPACPALIERPAGTWHSNWSELAGYRKALTTDVHRNNTGFRVAKSLR
jgi:hypothetical protein